MKIINIIAISFTMMLIACNGETQNIAEVESPSIDEFFQEFTEDWIRINPQLAVRTQYFPEGEKDQLSRQMTPFATEEWEQNRIILAQQGLEQLSNFDRALLTDEHRLSADMMQWQLQNVVDSEQFLDYDYPFQQMNGVNIGFPNYLTVIYPIFTERDAENYIAVLSQLRERIEAAIIKSEEQVANGIVPPRFILEATINSMEIFIDPEPSDNPLVTAFAEKLEAVEEVDATRKTQLLNEVIAMVDSEVYPVWQEVIDTLFSQQDRATDDAGLWRFEAGETLYAQRLQTFTTTDLSPDEIHEIGLREVARIEQEMDGLFRQLGYNEGSISERVAQLTVDTSYPNTDAGRELIMSDIQSLLSDALTRTEGSFEVRPQSEVIAQPYPEFRWASAAASYSAPPADGSRPGIFQMPLRQSQLTQVGLRSLVYHETVPGHHFQVALAVENKNLPAFRSLRALGGISASSEGWALYAERFAAEDGWYDDDPVGRLGQLDSELFRARRLVVDTGLHAMGWTRQQAIDYGIEASEIERYVVMPGQATSYMIGQLKIIELRERAREALGENFSLQEYHNLVLETGIVPLEILERVVDRYIDETLASI